ncbi:hypothetical protein JCM8097_007543 [Rhodosporidiobolus ruineniae]
MDSSLLAQIQKGKGLKKTQTNDRSQAQGVGAVLDASGGAPKPRAPAVPKPAAASGGDEEDTTPRAPQLGGLFAGVGMPTLKKTGAPGASTMLGGGGGGGGAPAGQSFGFSVWMFSSRDGLFFQASSTSIDSRTPYSSFPSRARLARPSLSSSGCSPFPSSRRPTPGSSRSSRSPSSRSSSSFLWRSSASSPSSAPSSRQRQRPFSRRPPSPTSSFRARARRPSSPARPSCAFCTPPSRSSRAAQPGPSRSCGPYPAAIRASHPWPARPSSSARSVGAWRRKAGPDPADEESASGGAGLAAEQLERPFFGSSCAPCSSPASSSFPSPTALVADPREPHSDPSLLDPPLAPHPASPSRARALRPPSAALRPAARPAASACKPSRRRRTAEGAAAAAESGCSPACAGFSGGVAAGTGIRRPART